MEETIIIQAVFIRETQNSWLLDCEGDEVWFPKSQCTFVNDREELSAPKWLLIEKFPGEHF
ncbi:hypothetical protein [Flagellimonas nanhaiensis]|uniref:Uncharacterized protein n=1 Tax=Flagellimonas nanhaiensis TaxID=2292706 RepID=A0A371JL83_9FLAO|nr:hypothetical protein [Allomuricauda nanhaiensis]RDY57698.1 hypothetical protein DX873_17510 [Allomuricauda nanhaiensis]